MHYLLLFLCFFSKAVFAKICVITCATGALGQIIGEAVAPEYDLILTGKDLDKLQKLQQKLSLTYPNHYAICELNFLNPQKAFSSYLQNAKPTIEGLVLITPRPGKGKILLQEESAWLELLQMTFTGPLQVLKNLKPYLSNRSKIVVIAGTTSEQLQPEYGLSCIIRRMWTTCTKALSHELSPHGITINALSPGVVLTPFHEERIQEKADLFGLDYNEQMRQETANIPLHRHAKPQEIAQTIQFLLSEKSDFINGINLIIDGGFTTAY